MAERFHDPNLSPVASKADRAVDSVEALERRVDRLLLLNQAMWELIKEKLDFSDPELQSRMLEVDARDGRVDGKLSVNSERRCKKCSKVLQVRNYQCLYCGTSNQPEGPFATV